MVNKKCMNIAGICALVRQLHIKWLICKLVLPTSCIFNNNLRNKEPMEIKKESLYIMDVGDECAFVGYQGVSCLMLRFIYEVHDKFPFVELGFSANAVIVLISMFNSNIKETYQYFLLNSSLFEMIYLTIYYFCHGAVTHDSDIGNCLPTRSWLNETSPSMLTYIDSNTFVAIVRTTFRYELYCIYFALFLLTLSRFWCIFSAEYRDKLNNGKNVAFLIIVYDIFIRLYAAAFFYIREIYEESGIYTNKYDNTVQTVLMIIIMLDAIIRVLLIFSSMLMSFAIFTKVTKQMKFQMENSQRKLLKISLRIAICLIIQSITYFIYIIISLSENVLLLNLTLPTSLHNLLWAFRYAQEPFLHVCILINSIMTLCFIGGYRQVIIAILKLPVKLCQNLRLKLLKQYKTPVAVITINTKNSTRENVNNVSANETTSTFSWVKRFLIIDKNNPIIFNKQQISAIILLLSSIIVAGLVLAINKTDDPTFLTSNNATTTTTTVLPNLVTEVNVTTSFIVGTNVSNYDASSSLQPLSSCACNNGTRYFYPNQSKELSDWTIQPALSVCNGYNSTDCVCEEMCICGYSLLNTTCYSLLPNSEAHVTFYPYCSDDGDCNMYTVFEGVTYWNFINELGNHPPKTSPSEAFGPNSKFFLASSVGCYGCEELLSDVCTC